MRSNAEFINALNQPIKRMSAELKINGVNFAETEIISVDFGFEGSIMHTVMSKLELEIKTDGLTKQEIFDLKSKYVTKCLIKVQVVDDPTSISYVYESFDIASEYGQFIVYSVEVSGKTNTAKLLCYDRMLESMKPIDFSNIGGYGTDGIINIGELISFIYNEMGWYPPQTWIFPNVGLDLRVSDIISQYTATSDDSTILTYRDLLDDISQVTASVIGMGGWNSAYNQARIKISPPTIETIDSEPLTIPARKLINVEYNELCKGINKLIISNYDGGILAEIEDTDEIATNGENSIEISNNKLLNGDSFNQFGQIVPAAENAKQAIFDALTNNSVYQYNPYTLNSYACGYFIDCGDAYRIKDINDETIYAICMNFNFHYGDTVSETASAEDIKNAGDDVYYYSNQTDTNTASIARLESDSEWIDVDFDESGYFTHYSTNEKLQYRKYGNLVEIRGAAKATRALTITNAETRYNIGSIDFLPSKSVVLLRNGSNKAIWRCIIGTDGVISVSRYMDDTGLINIPNNAWLSIHAMFLLG